MQSGNKIVNVNSNVLAMREITGHESRLLHILKQTAQMLS